MIKSLYPTFQRWSEKGSVWIISDTHFADPDSKLMSKNWPTPSEYIALLRQYVHKNDTVIHLGDVGDPKYMDDLPGYKVLIMGNHDSSASKLREHFDEVLTQLTDVNIRKSMNETYNEITSEKIRESIKTNDVMIVETINSLEEIEDTAGKLIERLREWCTPYLPEMEKLHNHELYSKVIATQTSRENIINSGILDNTHVSLSENYDVDISESDLEIIKSFANSVYSLYESKNELEEYIDEKIKEVAPNMYDVAGANLAAKLIAHTNGLETLAKLPSSTIQIIGAEKAIFRHLKTGENPPKHGLIFQHPSIRGSNWWVRGKLARAVASKITIAARKDAFSNEYDPNLKVELDERIEEIKKSHPFPERKKNKQEENDKKSKKGKKSKKEKGKKKKRNKRKLRKGEYNY